MTRTTQESATTGNAVLTDPRPSITKHAGGYQLRAAILLNRPRDEIFEFFADARNLALLTPPFLRFEITTSEPIQMHEGARIDYRIRFRGIPLRWATEIVEWNPPYQFTDNQNKGPYRRWNHTHTFTETPQGTLCEDLVDYSVFGGAVIHKLFVRRDIESIFRYRTEKLYELFAT